MLGSSSVTALLLGFFGFRLVRVVDQQPAANRLQAKSPGSAVATQKAVAGPALNRLAADPEPTPDWSLRFVQPVQVHVDALLECIHENFNPGDVLEASDMAELYEYMCCQRGLVPRPWNPIAAKLKHRMGRGPKGGLKPYRALLRVDGSVEEKRIWIVPERAKAGRQSSPRRRTAERRSTPRQPERLAA